MSNFAFDFTPGAFAAPIQTINGIEILGGSTADYASGRCPEVRESDRY